MSRLSFIQVLELVITWNLWFWNRPLCFQNNRYKIITHQFEHLNPYHALTNIIHAVILIMYYPIDWSLVPLCFLLSATINLLLDQGKLRTIGMSTFLYLCWGYHIYKYPDTQICLVWSEIYLTTALYIQLIPELAIRFLFAHYSQMFSRVAVVNHISSAIVGYMLGGLVR